MSERMYFGDLSRHGRTGGISMIIIIVYFKLTPLVSDILEMLTNNLLLVELSICQQKALHS